MHIVEARNAITNGIICTEYVQRRRRRRWQQQTNSSRSLRTRCNVYSRCLFVCISHLKRSVSNLNLKGRHYFLFGASFCFSVLMRTICAFFIVVVVLLMRAIPLHCIASITDSLLNLHKKCSSSLNKPTKKKPS